MKFEYIPENDFEKSLMKQFQEELDKRRSDYDTDERLMILEEMLMKNQTAGVMENMILKSLATKVEVMWGDDGEPSIDQRVEILEEAFKRFPETVLELEQTKIRLKNTEDDLRQALSKISSIEQTIANLRCMSDAERLNRKNMCDVINAQADQLDRLNREVFDEEPEEVKE